MLCTCSTSQWVHTGIFKDICREYILNIAILAISSASDLLTLREYFINDIFLPVCRAYIGYFPKERTNLVFIIRTVRSRYKEILSAWENAWHLVRWCHESYGRPSHPR